MAYPALIVAATLVISIGLVHSILGEKRLIGPLLLPGKRRGMLEKSEFARQVLRFAWHLTTLAWFGFGATLAGLALRPLTGQGRMVLMIVALTLFATGLLTLVATRGRHLAWPVFFSIAALCAWPLL